MLARRSELRPRPGLADELIAVARRHLRRAEDARVEEARVCLRALIADGMPVASRAIDGLYVIATHSGVTLAPVLARFAAAELTGDLEEPVLAPFRPQRFAAATD
jgi:glycine/D-amino acid oxidase-like deaminating enzyme